MRIFYASERSGPWQSWSRAADGSDEERQISKIADYSATPSALEALDPAAAAGRLNVVVNWFEEIRRK